MSAITQAILCVLALPLVGCGSDLTPARDPATRDPWEAARRRGIDFRALGQEPGWFLEIDEGRSMHLVYDYMERQVTTPAPPPTRQRASAVYSASKGPDTLEVLVERRPCQDGMSGFEFPYTVTLYINRRELRGCGRSLQ